MSIIFVLLFFPHYIKKDFITVYAAFFVQEAFKL